MPFDPEPAEIREYWDRVARHEAVLRRLDELDVHNAVNRINASEAPIEARDKVYRHRLRLMDMMASRAREKGVRSLYDELTPSMREELGQIQKIEVEAGTAPPGPEPAVALSRQPPLPRRSQSRQSRPRRRSRPIASDAARSRTEPPPPDPVSARGAETATPAPTKATKEVRKPRTGRALRDQRHLGAPDTQ